ncbi:MAG: SH3 domain-containing protein [Epsilonproteobacteria bacterium]|nr:SH3 domain-containing protein [Campylobacterota bacterium]
MKKYIFIILLSTLLSSLLADTILTKGERPTSELDSMPSNHVNDTMHIEQDTTGFSQQAEPMSATEQLSYDELYNAKYFEPWQLIEMDLSHIEKTWQFKYAKEKTYRRSGRKISKKWYAYQIENSNFNNYNSVAQPAITTKHTDLKLYPTQLEIFYDPNRTGEGFPFDYNQNSAVHINTPVFVSHYSKDAKWVYVKTSYAFGWIHTEDLAFVTSDFQSEFQNGKYAVTVTDNLNILEDGVNLSLVKMGSIFPMDSVNKAYLFAGKDKNGYAYLKRTKASEINLIAKKPIKFNQYNIAYISNQLVGEPYGWGGKLQARDCSALTRDFFAPFGIYLPRNSRQQAKESMGEYISLKGLSEKERQDTILGNAKPFRSLLYVPGHITLYLGEKNGEPVMLHNYWGVRLDSGKKHVMGRAIISTTKPGVERSDIRRRSMLSNTLKGVINF